MSMLKNHYVNIYVYGFFCLFVCFQTNMLRVLLGHILLAEP